MKIIIDYAGNRYESAENNTSTVEEASEWIYEQIDKMEKFQIELADGGKLILCSQAIQRAVIMILP